MSSFDNDGECTLCIWLRRLVSLACIAMVIPLIGLFLRRGNIVLAIAMIGIIPVLACFLSRTWTESLFEGVAFLKRYVEGVEGDHRHEWYAFGGQRIRVYLDDKQDPWFDAKDIAPLLGLSTSTQTFRSFNSLEYGIPKSANRKALSERGMRKLIKQSKHSDAGALGIWLDREVLRVLDRKKDL